MNHYMEMNTGGEASNVSNSLFPADNNDVERSPTSSQSQFLSSRYHQGAANRSNSMLPSGSNNEASRRSTASRTFHDVAGATSRSNSNIFPRDRDSERIIAPDYSIFSASIGVGDLEPLPLNARQNPQQQAALQSMVKESVEFIFGQPKKAPGDSGKKRKRRDSADDGGGSDDEHCSDPARFRAYQAEQWNQKIADLVEFRRIHGHCSVPYDYPPNPTLARWVKRQRYQYKLFNEGQASAMTARRIQALEKIGFVWDTYSAAWERRISELRAYRAENGNCSVPATYQPNKKLAAWVKCQRRQYKLYQEGKANTLTTDRIAALNRMGFHWEVRSYRS